VNLTCDEGVTPAVQHTITERIIDKDGGFTDYTANITVNNVRPTATLSAPTSVDEAASFAVSLTGGTDVSQADRDAGLHYAYAKDGGKGTGTGYAAADGTSAMNLTVHD